MENDQRPLTPEQIVACAAAAWRECQRLDRAEVFALEGDSRLGKDAWALSVYYLRRIQKRAMDAYWRN